MGSYFSRPTWLEEMARHRELIRLATSDEHLLTSHDVVPLEEWLASYGLDAREQWMWGFALSTQAHAWDATRHPHVPAVTAVEALRRLRLDDRMDEALALISADRHDFTNDFTNDFSQRAMTRCCG